jgi:hypothetical protein
MFILNNKKSLTESISLKGFVFDLLSDVWILDRSTSVDLAFLSGFERDVREGLVDVLSYYAESYSPRYVYSICGALKKYLYLTGERCFTQEGFILFKSKMKKSDKESLSTIRCVLRQSLFLGIKSVVDDAVMNLINEWTIGGNEKGIPVISLDPDLGPYSDLEFESIGYKASIMFSEGDISVEQYTCLLIYMASGRRSVQISSLKIKDFRYTNEYTGEYVYVGMIPRAKTRYSTFRSSFTAFAFTKEIGKIIEMLIKDRIKGVNECLSVKLTDEEKNELPLFIDPRAIKELKNIALKDRIVYLKSEMPHIISIEMSDFLNDSVHKLKVISERTGELIHSTAYRFRYTIGTRAAREGAGIITIAKLLDHSDTQNAGVYIQNIPEHAVEISNIMNQPLARYATAFAGEIVKNEEVSSEKEPLARIPFREADADLGSCGTDAFCLDYAPIACYVCPQFKPWLYAPHYKVLNWLLEERERVKASTDSDMQIVSINDRVIVAVKQVIERCEELKNEENS